MSDLTRRELVRRGVAGATFALTLPVLGACGENEEGGGGSDVARVGWQTSWLPGVEWTGSYVAAERGYYREAGLDVQIRPGGPQVAGEPLIASGRALVGSTYGTGVANANNSGADIRILGTKCQRLPTVIVSLPAKPVREPRDLIGMKVGVPDISLGVFGQFLNSNGIDPKQVKRVPAQTSYDALVNNQVDAKLGYAPELAALEEKGIDVEQLFLSDHGYADVVDAYGASVKNISERRDDIVGFLRAEVRGWQDAVADPEYAAKLAVTKYAKQQRLDLGAQTREMKIWKGLIEYGDFAKQKGLCRISPQALENYMKVVNAAVKGKTFEPGQIFDVTVMDDAFDGKSRL